MKTKHLFSALGFALAMCLANLGFAQFDITPLKPALEVSYDNDDDRVLWDLQRLSDQIPISRVALNIRGNITFTGGEDGGVYTLVADIGGNGSITMAGKGTLVWAGNNTYAGGTTIVGAGAIIKIQSSSALGTGPLTVKDGGKLELDMGAATATVGQISLTNGATLSAVSGQATLQGSADGGTAIDISGTLNLSAINGASLILKGTGSNDNAVGVNVATDATINSNGDVTVQGIGDGSTGNRHSVRFNGNTNLNAQTGSLKVAGQGPGVTDNTAYGMVQNVAGTINTSGNVTLDAASGISSSFSADHSLWRFASTSGALTINALQAMDIGDGGGECAFALGDLVFKAATGASIVVNGKAILAAENLTRTPTIIDTEGGGGNVTINSDIKFVRNTASRPGYRYIRASGNLTINGGVSGDGDVGDLYIGSYGGVVTFNGTNTFKGTLLTNIAGDVVFTGSNQFSGLRVINSGKTIFRSDASFPSAFITKFQCFGAVYFEDALHTFPINVLANSDGPGETRLNADESLRRVYFTKGKLNVANNLTIDPWTQFFGDVEIGQTDKTLTLRGTVNGSGSLKKTGTGMVVFDNINDNEYSGTATIVEGALVGASNKAINAPQMAVVVEAGGKIYSSGGSAESAFSVGVLTMAAQGSGLDVYGAGSGASRINSASFSAPTGFTVNVKNDFAEGDYIILSSRHTITTGEQPVPTLGDRANLDPSKNVCFSWDGNNVMMHVFGSTTISAASSTPTLCVNTRLADITYTSKIALLGEISNERLPTGVSATASDKVLTISGIPTEQGTFDYTVTIGTSGGRCPVVASGKIIVTDANGSTNTGSAASSTVPVCANTPLTAITHNTTGATGVANAGQAGANGLPSGVSATWANNQVIITGTPLVEGTFPYSIPLTGGCGDASVTGTITVTSDATGGNSVGAASSAPRLCANTPLTPITHATAGATGVGEATDLPAGVIATWANNTITISGTPTASGVFNYRIPLTGGCGAVTATGRITVSGPDVQVGPPSSTPSVCGNTRILDITHSTLGTGVTGIQDASGLPLGLTATWRDDVVTISGVTGGVLGRFDYTINLTSPCGAFQAKGTIEVVNAIGSLFLYGNRVRPASPPSASTVCVGAPIDIQFLTSNAQGIGTPTGLPNGVTATWTFQGFTVDLNSRSGNILISGATTEIGSFDYKIPVVGGCGNPDVMATGTLIVTESLVGADDGVTVRPVQPSSSIKLCVNTQLVEGSFTFTTTGVRGIANRAETGKNGLPPGVAARFLNEKDITFYGIPTKAGMYNFKIPLLGPCVERFAEGTITVLSNIAGEPSSTPTLCANTPMTAITHSTLIADASGIGNPTGLPSGVTATWANDVITLSGTPTVAAGGTFNYSIPLTFESGRGCGTAVARGTITVRPANASRSNTGGSASSVSSACSGSVLTPITHNTTGATGLGTPTGLPAGVTARWANNLVTISGSPAGEPGDYPYTIPLTGGCGVVSVSGVIKITSPTGIANTVTDASGTSTACINTALTPITHATTGATGIGTPTRLPAGVTARWANNVITVAGAPTEAGTFNYEIPLTGGCSPTPVTAKGTINVSGSAVVNWAGQASSTPTVCTSTPLAEITHTTTGATGIGPAFGLPTGVTAAWANNTIKITGTPTQDGTFAYRIPLTGSCGAAQALGTLTVLKKATVAQASLAPTLVVNTPLPTITHTTTDASSIGNATNLPQGVTANWANNTITISGTPTNAGSFAYSIPVQGCGKASANAEGRITVTLATAGVPSSNPASAVVNTPITPGITILTDGATGIGTPEGLPPGVTASFDNGVITISGTPTDDGVYNYRIPLEGGGFADGTIVVAPAPSGGTPSSNPATVVVNTPLTPPVTIPTNGATGIGTPEGLPPGVTATFANGVVTISGTPTDDGTFDYWIPLEGGGFVEGRIVVTPPTASEPSPNPATVTVNRPLDPAITIATQGATGIIEPIVGLPPGVTATFANGVITISGTPTDDGTFNYRIPLEGGGFAEGTILVTPPRGGTPSVNPATVVVNTPLTPSITIPADGATAIGVPEGLPAGIRATINNGVVTISGTPTEDGTFDYWIPLEGGGFVEGRIIVTPATAGEPSENPAFGIVNTALEPVTIATQGATGIGTPAGLPPGVTATFANGVITIDGTPSATGTFDYRIPLTGGGFAEGRIIVTTPIPDGQAHDPVTVVVNTPITPPILVETPDGTTGIGTPANLPPGVTARLDENGDVIVSGTPTSGGVFDYEIPLEPTGSIKGRIIVTPPVADEPSPNPAIVVVNTPVAPPITIDTEGATGIGIPQGLPPGVVASFNNGVITISGTPRETGSFDYRIPLTGGGFADGRIIVTSPTAAEPSRDPVSLTVNTRLDPPVTIATQGTDGIGEPIGLPEGVTATWDNGVITLVGNPTEVGSFDYRIPLNGGGFASGTINVTPPTAGTASPDPATVVVNTPVTPPITIPTTGATGIGTPENLPPGMTASFDNGVITLSGTPTSQGSFDYRIPLNDGGFADGRIVVTSPTAEEPSSDPASVVVNVPIAPPITIATNGTDGIGEPIIGLPPGVTASFNNGVISLSGTPTEEGTFNYRIPLNGGGFATGTINVLVRQSASEALSSPEFCTNAEITAVDMHTTTRATGIGTPTDFPPGLVATWANNTITIKGKPTTAGVFNYKIPLTGGAIAVNATGTITVKGPALPSFEITGFEDGIRALLTSSATAGNQWFKNGEPIAGATNPTHTVDLRNEFGLTNKELAKDKFTVKVTGEAGCTSESAHKTLGITTADEPRNTSRSVVVYPNPVTDQTTVLLAGYEGRKTIVVYNLIGEKLSQQQIDGDTATISLVGYPSGTYIVKVAGSNSEKSVLVIKQ